MTDTKSPAEMLEALGKPFPKTAIKQRRGGGGKSLSYVETHTVIHRLNSATNGDWSFHIRDVQWRNDVLMVQGELTIPGLGTRSGFGVQQVVERAGEDLVKGAASDALKKCATLFGVALELYGSDYEANVPPQAPQTARNAPKPSSATPDTNAPANLDRTRVTKALHAEAKKHGFEHIDLHNLIVAKGHESIANAPVEALVELGKAIKADAGKLKAWLEKQSADQAELIPGTDTVPNPDRFTS